MDHLPGFDDALEPWSVASHGGQYDSLKMREVPIHTRSNERSWENPPQIDAMQGASLAYLQALLYFDPIVEVLDAEDPVNWFTRNDEEVNV